MTHAYKGDCFYGCLGATIAVHDDGTHECRECDGEWDPSEEDVF